jgi:hypothetical protein
MPGPIGEELSVGFRKAMEAIQAKKSFEEVSKKLSLKEKLLLAKKVYGWKSAAGKPPLKAGEAHLMFCKLLADDAGAAALHAFKSNFTHVELGSFGFASGSELESIGTSSGHITRRRGRQTHMPSSDEQTETGSGQKRRPQNANATGATSDRQHHHPVASMAANPTSSHESRQVRAKLNPPQAEPGPSQAQATAPSRTAVRRRGAQATAPRRTAVRRRGAQATAPRRKAVGIIAPPKTPKEQEIIALDKLLFHKKKGEVLSACSDFARTYFTSDHVAERIKDQEEVAVAGKLPAVAMAEEEGAGKPNKKKRTWSTTPMQVLLRSKNMMNQTGTYSLAPNNKLVPKKDTFLYWCPYHVRFGKHEKGYVCTQKAVAIQTFLGHMKLVHPNCLHRIEKPTNPPSVVHESLVQFGAKLPLEEASKILAVMVAVVNDMQDGQETYRHYLSKARILLKNITKNK